MNNSIKKSANSQYVNFKYAKGKIDIYRSMFHNYWEIYLFLNGNVEFVNSHIRQKLKPYQLIIVPPREYHQFIVKDNIDLYERCVIEIKTDFFKNMPLDQAFEGKESIELSHSDRIAEHYAYLAECVRTLNTNDLEYILPAVAADIVLIIKNTRHSSLISQIDTSKNLSFVLMRYIDEHYKEKINLEFLAKNFHSSVSLICHKFKNDFGVSIKKYIMKKRLIGSNQALLNGENAEEVCMKFGFSNYSAFYRAYKNEYGISPSETAKQKT